MIEADRARLIDDTFPKYKFWDDYVPEKQTGRVPSYANLVRRKSDGEMFEASSPGFPDMGSLFNDEYPKFLFRQIKSDREKWWQFWLPKWRRTGKVWRARTREFDLAGTVAKPTGTN